MAGDGSEVGELEGWTGATVVCWTREVAAEESDF